MGFSGISIWQLLIVLVIVVLIFGTKRLKGMGTDVGGFIKGFRGAMSGGDDDEKKKSSHEEKKLANESENLEATNEEADKIKKESKESSYVASRDK